MRIAMISTVYHATPPTGYGGIERVVYRLTEELVRQGHEVTLFGAKGSRCSGKTVVLDSYDPSQAPSGIRKGSDIINEEAMYESMKVYLEKNPVDIIHDFTFQNLYVLRHPQSFPFIISTCVPPTKGYVRPNLVACSQAHAQHCGPKTKFVHYGLNMDEFPAEFNKTTPMIHISKIASYKAQHLAIDAARKLKAQLWVAGNIEEKAYYYTQILPRLFISPTVKYIGEIQGTTAHLKTAKALIQTPQWFDAFPLVVLESLACGTPVIGLKMGGLPEQIKNGVNGFLCDTPQDLKQAMKEIDSIKPQDCRSYAEKHFNITRMAKDYIDLYDQSRKGVSW